MWDNNQIKKLTLTPFKITHKNMSNINKEHLDFCQMMNEQSLHNGWEYMANNIRLVNKPLSIPNAKELIFDRISLTYRFFAILMRLYGYKYADTENQEQNDCFANWLVQYWLVQLFFGKRY
eukprot:480565_1